MEIKSRIPERWRAEHGSWASLDFADGRGTQRGGARGAPVANSHFKVYLFCLTFRTFWPRYYWLNTQSG